MTKATLYHCADARSLRCLWAVEEVGMDIELQNLPFPPRAFAPEYKAINPLGTVPAWIEGGLLMTESAAIVERIVDGTSLAVAPVEPDHWDYRNWLHRSDATLTFPLAIMLRYSRLEQGERRQPQVVDDYRAFFGGRARSIESALSDGREWLVAGRFTAADIAVGYAAFLAGSVGADGELGNATQAWLARCTSRGGFARARARQTGRL
ncbi:MAG: Glutathione S-transferase [Pseudomonadota bacterium]